MTRIPRNSAPTGRPNRKPGNVGETEASTCVRMIATLTRLSRALGSRLLHAACFAVVGTVEGARTLWKGYLAVQPLVTAYGTWCFLAAVTDILGHR